MRALSALTIANIKSYLRDRAAVFWTLAFPLIFIFMFGFIFQGSGGTTLNLAFVDQDGSATSTQLHAAFAAANGVELTDPADRAAAEAAMKDGEVDAIIVVPAGYGAALSAATAGSGAPASVTVVIDPSRSSLVLIGRPGGGERPRRGQPRRPPAAGAPAAGDHPDREPLVHQLLRPEHPRDVDHADRDLRGRPARGGPREGHPQAPRGDAAPPLAAGRLATPSCAC